MPNLDSSGWFLIEKTTILTNSYCLYVQPTFGYLRGSAFGSAAEPKVGWFSTPTKKTVQFSRTSLSYRPIAALSNGVDRRPRSIRIFAQIRAELFAFLGLWHCHKKVPRPNLRSRHSTLTYEGEPTAVVVALYRRLEQLGYEVNRRLWWWPSTGDSNNYSTLFYLFLSTKISIFFSKININSSDPWLHWPNGKNCAS